MKCTRVIAMNYHIGEYADRNQKCPCIYTDSTFKNHNCSTRYLTVRQHSLYRHLTDLILFQRNEMMNWRFYVSAKV